MYKGDDIEAHYTVTVSKIILLFDFLNINLKEEN